MKTKKKMRNVLAQLQFFSYCHNLEPRLSLLCLVIERKLTEREIGIEVLTVSILQGNEWTTLYLTLSKSSFNSKLKTPFLILTC